MSVAVGSFPTWLTLFADFESLKLNSKVDWARVKAVKGAYNAKVSWLESQLSPRDDVSAVSIAFTEWWARGPYAAGSLDIIFGFNIEGQHSSSIRTRTLHGTRRIEANLCLPLPKSGDAAPQRARDDLAKALDVVAERFKMEPSPALPLTKRELARRQAES